MYVVRTIPGAERDIERLKKQIRQDDLERLTSAIRGLASEPRPQGVKKIKGRENSYRVRVGEYRVVYEIQDKIQTITIIEVVRRTGTTYNI